MHFFFSLLLFLATLTLFAKATKQVEICVGNDRKQVALPNTIKDSTKFADALQAVRESVITEALDGEWQGCTTVNRQGFEVCSLDGKVIGSTADLLKEGERVATTLRKRASDGECSFSCNNASPDCPLTPPPTSSTTSTSSSTTSTTASTSTDTAESLYDTSTGGINFSALARKAGIVLAVGMAIVVLAVLAWMTFNYAILQALVEEESHFM